jgi:hypothetical protein
MQRLHVPVVLLRVFLASLFAFLVLMQAFSLPGMFSYRAQQTPTLAPVSWSMLAFFELEVLCFQLVIVCTWKLLTMVEKDRIFSDASMAWVNGIVWSFAAAWLILVAESAFVTGIIYFTPQLRDPGTPILLFGIVLVGAVLVLLLVILRALLRQATTLRTEMEQVI